MTPSHVIFIVKENLNLGIALEVVDKRKALARRRLIQSSFEYEGAKIKLDDLYTSKTRAYGVTVSQTIDLETDIAKNCITGVLKQKPNFLNCSTGLSTDS